MAKKKLTDLISDVHSYHINAPARTIYLHGAYSNEEPGVEYRMATTFVKNLHILDQEEKSNILVHMHSIGGEWGDGMAIFNAIEAARSPVTIIAYAQASSMSGIILQAADKRVLTADCEFLIHHGDIEVEASSMAAKSAIDVNERQCKRMLQIFAAQAIMGEFFQEKEYNLSKTKAYIDRKIKDKSDWCMTAEEAVHYGFADGILGKKRFETIEKVRGKRKKKIDAD